jgi:DNA repair exonuclease SbcCD nuclease subunit
MKISVMADLHLNKATYKTVMDRQMSSLSFRSADFMRAFEWAVDECINNVKPDLVVIAGDEYDTYNPNNEIRGFFSKQLKKLIENDISVRILIGNHDVCQKHSSLSDIEELGLKNIQIISNPKVEIFKNKNKEEIRLLLFPYSLDIERGIRSSKEEFNLFLDDVKKRTDNNMESLFFGHFPLFGGIMNRYNIGEDDNTLDNKNTPVETDTTSTLTYDKNQHAYKNVNKNDIGINDLDRLGDLNVGYVFLGDFHEYQFIDTKKCKSWYCGSLEKNSFNEINHVKSFMVYDSSANIDEKMGCCKSIPYSNCRPMIDLFGNLKEMKEIFYKIDLSDKKDCIVRLNFSGSKEDLAEFKVSHDEFKKDIISKTNAIHIYHNICKITDVNIIETLEKLDNSVKDNNHTEIADVIEVVKEMIDERISDETERKEISELAMEIYKKTISLEK